MVAERGREFLLALFTAGCVSGLLICGYLQLGSALIKQTITQLALNRPQNWVHVNRHGVNVEVDLLAEVATHDALPKNTAAS